MSVVWALMLSVSLRPPNYIREDVIYFFEYGPFPAYLKRFHLSDSYPCSCGGTGMVLHHVTEGALTVSGHIRKLTPNFEQEWLKRVSNNLVSKQKIHRIVKFISETEVSSYPPSLQLSRELK
ncbi:hypothetical protein AVEN_61188-1 [Araneus ventricosus]|uniref:Uncharacterized protein n=1 Tax=Araneus ventricosus TaxID=182803 RepID=A0A4Y2R062_ARAVE|nr:hypothetical protein AVEN_61188-1 [Araneus ventricosus]